MKASLSWTMLSSAPPLCNMSPATGVKTTKSARRLAVAQLLLCSTSSCAFDFTTHFLPPPPPCSACASGGTGGRCVCTGVVTRCLPPLQCVCEWRERGPLFVRLEREVRRDLAAGRLPPVQPFHIMAYPFPADLAKVAACVFGGTGCQIFYWLPAVAGPALADCCHRRTGTCAHADLLAMLQQAPC
jgi:hypothetical protein